MQMHSTEIALENNGCDVMCQAAAAAAVAIADRRGRSASSRRTKDGRRVR
jgi:hypothetical protein